MKLEDIKVIVTEDEKRKHIEGNDLGQWIDSLEASKILGVTQARVRQMVANGDLVSHPPKDGRRDHMFKRADVIALSKKDRKPTGRPKGS